MDVKLFCIVLTLGDYSLGSRVIDDAEMHMHDHSDLKSGFATEHIADSVYKGVLIIKFSGVVSSPRSLGFQGLGPAAIYNACMLAAHHSKAAIC